MPPQYGMAFCELRNEKPLGWQCGDVGVEVGLVDNLAPCGADIINPLHRFQAVDFELKGIHFQLPFQF